MANENLIKGVNVNNVEYKIDYNSLANLPGEDENNELVLAEFHSRTLSVGNSAYVLFPWGNINVPNLNIYVDGELTEFELISDSDSYNVGGGEYINFYRNSLHNDDLGIEINLGQTSYEVSEYPILIGGFKFYFDNSTEHYIKITTSKETLVKVQDNTILSSSVDEGTIKVGQYGTYILGCKTFSMPMGKTYDVTFNGTLYENVPISVVSGGGGDFEESKFGWPIGDQLNSWDNADFPFYISFSSTFDGNVSNRLPVFGISTDGTEVNSISIVEHTDIQSVLVDNSLLIVETSSVNGDYYLCNVSKKELIDAAVSHRPVRFVGDIGNPTAPVLLTYDLNEGRITSPFAYSYNLSDSRLGDYPFFVSIIIGSFHYVQYTLHRNYIQSIYFGSSSVDFNSRVVYFVDDVLPEY